MVRSHTEAALYQQGRRDAYTGAVSARECRNHPSVIYRDGWREGIFKKILEDTKPRRASCSETKSV